MTHFKTHTDFEAVVPVCVADGSYADMYESAANCPIHKIDLCLGLRCTRPSSQNERDPYAPRSNSEFELVYADIYVDGNRKYIPWVVLRHLYGEIRALDIEQQAFDQAIASGQF